LSAGAATPDAAPHRPIIVAPWILSADFGRLAKEVRAIVAGSAIFGSSDCDAAIAEIHRARRSPAKKARS
jgi:pentose-5-phosphate-3-epimerase